MINSENIFQSGAIVHLNIRRWGATARAEDSVVKDDLNKEIIRAVQDLIKDKDKGSLEDIRIHRSKVKQFVFANSLPFPVVGMFFMPSDRIERVNDYLKEAKKKHEELVATFLTEYEELKAAFKEENPKLYRPENYPDRRRMERKFCFEWTFRNFGVPEFMPDDIKKAEVEKFKQEIEEMKSLTKNMVANEVVRRIAALAEQCDGGKINSATLAGINTFLEKFDDIWQGFFEGKELKQMIEEVRVYLADVDASMLRADDEFKEVVQKKMKDVVTNIQKMDDIELKRGIDL